MCHFIFCIDGYPALAPQVAPDPSKEFLVLRKIDLFRAPNLLH